MGQVSQLATALRMVNPLAKITNLAFNGASSLQSTAKLNLDNYKPSIVLGLDLFFWDTVREQVGEKFEENTRKLFQQIQARGIPMIIGKIPMVDLPLGNRAESIKKSALKINKLLEELCTLENNCLLYDPLDCLLCMDFASHFSENLHFTDEGNKFCAEFLARYGVYKNLRYLE